MSRMVQRGKMGFKKKQQLASRDHMHNTARGRDRNVSVHHVDEYRRVLIMTAVIRPPIRPTSLQFCLPLSILLTTRVHLTVDTCKKRHSDVTGAECPRVCRWAREMWVPDWLPQKRLEGATSGFLYKLSLMCLWEDWLQSHCCCHRYWRLDCLNALGTVDL